MCLEAKKKKKKLKTEAILQQSFKVIKTLKKLKPSLFFFFYCSGFCHTLK